MNKILSIVLTSLLAVILISTMAIAEDESTSLNSRQVGAGRNKIDMLSQNTKSHGQTRGIRQVYTSETTQRDRQQWTSPGRQIVYAGYNNPSCDYVYMVYSFRTEVGPATIEQIRFAIYDWILNSWDFVGAGPILISPPYNSIAANVDVSPQESYCIAAYQHRANSSSPWHTLVSTGVPYCPPDIFFIDSCPGPPNLEYVQTGYGCTDDDPVNSPYIWPRLSIDTIYDGNTIVHVASAEDTCNASEEVASLVYYRKISDYPDEPWTGTWEGPYFMDSAYIRSALVRADKTFGSEYVYYAYLKPIYYQEGTPHPCEAYGMEHYYNTNEVVYKYSYDEGQSWSPPIYITDYASQFETTGTEPACYDLSAMVDPNGVLHLVWSSANRDPQDVCSYYPASKMWHWDSDNYCISLAYDASHPANFTGETGKWNLAIAKHNISWCDDKLYISFTRFGAHPVGDWSYDAGLGDGTYRYENGDIMVVASDYYDGGMGVVWTSAVNLTDTESPDCAAGDCDSEHWPTMAMYSYDSLMIEYIEDKDPGGWEDDSGSQKLDNPVMFLTYQCFYMSDIPDNAQYNLDPDPPIWEDIEMAPYGDDVNCPAPAIVIDKVNVSNIGNVDLAYNAYSDAAWLSVVSGLSGYILPGAGPIGSYDPSWSGAPPCGYPTTATIEWEAVSFALPEGTYEGTIYIDFNHPDAVDTAIHVSLNVVCETECQGICGDANGDGGVNIADGVWIINYIFAGGLPPQPVLACGDANGDAGVNIADGVWIINYIFAGGDPPGDCSPGSPNWGGQDCCPFPSLPPK